MHSHHHHHHSSIQNYTYYTPYGGIIRVKGRTENEILMLIIERRHALSGLVLSFWYIDNLRSMFKINGWCHGSPFLNLLLSFQIETWRLNTNQVRSNDAVLWWRMIYFPILVAVWQVVHSFRSGLWWWCTPLARYHSWFYRVLWCVWRSIPPDPYHRIYDWLWRIVPNDKLALLNIQVNPMSTTQSGNGSYSSNPTHSEVFCALTRDNTLTEIKIKIGKMEADVSGGWTNSWHDMFLSPPLHWRGTYTPRCHIWTHRGLPNGDLERRDFLPRIAVQGSNQAISNNGDGCALNRAYVRSDQYSVRRMSVMYRRMQVDHSVIFDSLTLQLLQSMIWSMKYTNYHVDYVLHLHRQLIDRNKKKEKRKNKTYQSRLASGR